MSSLLILATGSGVSVCEREGDAGRKVVSGLQGRHVTCVITREGMILAGATDGVFRSDDSGRTWREASAGLSIRHVRWMACHPDIPDLDLAGPEPAGIFVSRDGGGSWRECPEVAALRDAHEWFLPYSDEAGCVRGLAFHGVRAYAACEVGGMLRSDDRGETWRLAEGSTGDPDPYTPPAPLVCPDVHAIHVHPSSPELVFAATGGGLYRSADGGDTWTSLYDCYCRDVWLDPADPDHFILGPAQHVGAGGRIEETRDGGTTWQSASTGLEVPWQRNMVERFAQVGDELLAVLDGGELLAASLPALEWRRLLPDIQRVNCVTGFVGS